MDIGTPESIIIVDDPVCQIVTIQEMTASTARETRIGIATARSGQVPRQPLSLIAYHSPGRKLLRPAMYHEEE
jgi:hypothetical protein